MLCIYFINFIFKIAYFLFKLLKYKLLIYIINTLKLFLDANICIFICFLAYFHKIKTNFKHF